MLVATLAKARQQVRSSLNVGDTPPSDLPGEVRIVDPANGNQDVSSLTMGTTGPSSTYQLGLVVVDSGNGNDLTGYTQVWSSDTPAVVTVDNTGLLTAVGAGSASITATATKHSVSSTDTTPAVITVGTPTVTSVSRTPATLSGIVGSTGTITYQAKDASNANVPGQTYTATSSDTGIATVSISGNVATVTYVAAGTCTITGHVGAIDSSTTGITVIVAGSFNEPSGMTPWWTLDLSSQAAGTVIVDGTPIITGMNSFEHYANATLTVQTLSDQSWNSSAPFGAFPSGLDKVIVSKQTPSAGFIVVGEKGKFEGTPTGGKVLYFRLPSAVDSAYKGEPHFKRWYIKGAQNTNNGSVVLLFFASGGGPLSVRVHYQFPSVNVIEQACTWSRNNPATIEVLFQCCSTIAAQDAWIIVYFNGGEVYRKSGLDFNNTSLTLQSLLDFVGGTTNVAQTVAQYVLLGDGAKASYKTSLITMP